MGRTWQGYAASTDKSGHTQACKKFFQLLVTHHVLLWIWGVQYSFALYYTAWVYKIFIYHVGVCQGNSIFMRVFWFFCSPYTEGECASNWLHGG